MSTVDWQRVRSIFEEALERTGEERAEFVESACGDDEELKEGVDELLAADSRADGVLSSPGLPDDPNLFGEIAGELMAGRRIGAYTITGTIAVGGMGTVFEAEQESPRRTVALKVIRFGLATPDATRRARYEAEVLARLQHPGIAQVFEAGTYREVGGQLLPFFAMEYVEGARGLIEYADEQGLDQGGRLALFGRVCAAVQHGHEKGVIHRDLKPGNILVDTSGNPKVIDFGLARAADPKQITDSLRTEAGHIAGTLQYMAPEQLEGAAEEVDTRADLYALGVVLFELLCGRPPIETHDVSLLEAARRLKEEPPARPSSIRGDLPRELDWILLRALEKDATRRYASAGELAEDLRRFRANEPVLAGPPSQTYRLSLFVRRHRVAVGATLVVFIALILGVVGTGIGMVRAQDAQRLAERETDRAIDAEKEAREAQGRAQDEADKYREVAEFTRGLFQVADPRYSGGEEVTARDLLDRGALRVERGELQDRPKLRGAMLWTLGDAYSGLGDFDRSIPLLESAVELGRESHRGEDHLDVAGSLDSLAGAYYELDRLEEAEALHHEALEMRRRLVGEESEAFATSLNNVALSLHRAGRLEEAEPLYRRALSIKEARLGTGSPSLVSALNNLALLLNDRGEFAEATEHLERAALICELEYEHPHPDRPFSLHNLGVVRWHVGELDEARVHFERALQVARELYPGDHPQIASILGDLGQVANDLGDPRRAVRVIEEALEMKRRLLGDVHSEVALSLNNLAAAWKMLQQYDRAEDAYRESLEILEAIEGEESASIALGLNNLASLLRDKEEYEEATELFQEALEMNRRVHGDVHLNTAGTRLNLGRLLECQGRYDEAEEQLEEALSILLEIFGPGSAYEGIVLDALGIVLFGKGELERAEECFLAALEIHRAQVGETHQRFVKAIINLGRLRIVGERWEEAESTLLEGLTALEAAGVGDEDPYVQLLLQTLVETCEAAGRPEKAATWRERLSGS